jgi:hypothetical protein
LMSTTLADSLERVIRWATLIRARSSAGLSSISVPELFDAIAKEQEQEALVYSEMSLRFF